MYPLLIAFLLIVFILATGLLAIHHAYQRRLSIVELPMSDPQSSTSCLSSAIDQNETNYQDFSSILHDDIGPTLSLLKLQLSQLQDGPSDIEFRTSVILDALLDIESLLTTSLQAFTAGRFSHHEHLSS